MNFIKLTHSSIGLLISISLFIPNSKLIVTASTTFKTFAQAPGSYSPIELQPFTSTVKDVNFSPDGKYIINAFDNGIARIWNSNGKLITELKDGTREIKTAIFSPDSKFIFTSSSHTKIWDISGKLLTEIKEPNASLSPNGKLILTSIFGATLWDTSGKVLAKLKKDEKNPVTSANFSPDSKLIITTLRDGTVRIWNTSGKLITEFTGDSNLIKTAIFSPDGKLIFTTSFGTSKLWDTSGKLVAEFKGRHISLRSSSFSPDSKLIVTTSFNSSDFFNRNAKVWDTSGKEIAELKGHEADITGASFSPNGKHIVTVSNDGTARIWDTSGKLLATLQGHQGNVSKANFSPDGQSIITASDDGTSRLWNTNGKQLATLNLDEKIASSLKVEADRLRDLQFYAPNCNQAFDPWQKALKIYQDISDNQNQAIILEKLGNAYYCIGDYSNAIKSYTQASSIAQKSNYLQIQAKNISNQGNIYNTLADYETAIKKYNEALKLIPQENSYIKAEILRGRANIYNAQGKYNEAIPDYLQALATDEAMQNQSGIAENKVKLASIYLASGDVNKATQFYKEALEAKPIEALSGLGDVTIINGDINKAIDLYQQSLAKAQQQEDKEGEGNALNNLGVALYKSNKFVEAEKNLRAAIEIWENLRINLDDTNKVSIFEKQARTYQLLQQVLIAQNKPEAALEIAERGRARAFVELIAKRLAPNQQKQLKITPPNLEEIKRIAKNKKATLVEYSIINNQLQSEIYIWVIKPTGEVAFRKTDLKLIQRNKDTTLSQFISFIRTSIGVVDVRSRGITAVSNNSPNQGAQNENLQQLYKLLIQPIAGALPKNPEERVIFLPQDSLYLVPFPALQSPDGKYLIEKHTILTAPSIQVLDLTHKQQIANGESQVQNKQALVVGNPKMPNYASKPNEQPQPLPPLPGAEKEALAIAQILGTKAITGNAATKTEIVKKMTSSQIIHLATHGLFDDLRGLGSAIALAPSSVNGQQGSDGFLTAEEILNFKKLNTNLIVLSACDTGRGKITGDGVIGLSRSFISVGVPSIVVSLWSVDDDSTAFFMTKFYQNLQQKFDKATALRMAMLMTKQKYPQPLNWAAFTLIGEAE